MTEPEQVDRREPTERRRYQRRAPQTVTPPYFETFERIAVALESIAKRLEQRQVTMPDVAPRTRSTAKQD